MILCALWLLEGYRLDNVSTQPQHKLSVKLVQYKLLAEVQCFSPIIQTTPLPYKQSQQLPIVDRYHQTSQIMTKDVSKQYKMHLNTFSQGKVPDATFNFEEYQDGEPHIGDWVSTVTVTWISKDLAKKIPVGTKKESRAKKRTDANDAASKQMLDLFKEHGKIPKTGQK
ncbi:hypothetical protein FRC05_006175 [Tulasnella sp. 425]|nr:hypothetical protein FRC05_006175 [Tulasnella sp. 425]